MANPLRGEADLKVGAQTFRLVYNWNAACEFEEPAGCSLWEALTGKLTARSVRAMLWAGLRERHEGVELKEAGRMIDEVGRGEAVRVMRLALRHYFPELDQVMPPEGAAGPGEGGGAADAGPPGPAPAPAPGSGT